MTAEHTAAPPEAVIRAVEDKIETVQELMRHNADRIAGLTRQNVECEDIIAELEAWLKGARS